MTKLLRIGRPRAIALILLVAAVVRLYGVGFGLPAMNDPDELMFQMGAVRMLSGPTLNPGWFGHPGTTTIYLLALLDLGTFGLGWLLGWFADPHAFATAIYNDPTWVILPGRIAMALFSVWCVWLTYRLAQELFGQRAGLAAAALLALNPVHIAWSQVIRTDIMASCFMLLCLLAALRIAREGRLRDTILASLWLALAVATKWPFALGSLAVLGAIVLRIQADPAFWRTELRRAVLFGVLAVAFLFLASPFLLLDYPTVLRNLQGEDQLRHLGATGGTPVYNLWWYLRGAMLTGFGPLGAVLALAGGASVLRRREALAVIAPVALGFLLVICLPHLVQERWALPLFPLLCIAAGAALAKLAEMLRARLPGQLGSWAVAVLVAAMLVPIAVTCAENTRARLHDTRQIASAWARAHVPPGSMVMVEHFGFDLLHEPWGFKFPLGDRGCVNVRDMIQGKVGYGTIEAARGGRSNVDYGTVAPAARATCRADFAILTQYERYKAERGIFPDEYEAYRQLISTGRVVDEIDPVPGKSGGPIVTIVAFDRLPAQ